MFELIHAERAQFPIAFSCRVLEVSRAGYYDWLQRGPSARSQEDLRILAEILSIYKEHKGRYGSPRIHQELVYRGFNVGQNRVARLMADNGIQGRQKRRFKATTDSKHKLRVAPNVLERNFVAHAPNEKWVGDISVPQKAAGEMRDRPLAIGLQEQIANHRKRLGSKALVVSVAEKAP